MINKQTCPEKIIQQTIDQTIDQIAKQYTTTTPIHYMKITTKVKDKIDHITNLQTEQGMKTNINKIKI